MCLSACLNRDVWEGERVLLQADAGAFFSSGINFSPCVPSPQFLGRKETDLTMQKSLCSASSYKLKSYVLNNTELQTTPLQEFLAQWLCEDLFESAALQKHSAAAQQKHLWLNIEMHLL